jgi:carbamoyl-phosphate synthase large subunit
MEAVTVLVTGAGSAVGQAIIKALRFSGLPLRIVAADIGPLSAALYRADAGAIIPRVEDADALPRIMTVLREHRAHAVMVGSEFDLDFFSKHRDAICAQTGAIVLASSPKTVRIANDKWETAEFLRKNGLPYVESHVPRDKADARAKAASWGYPLVLKPRCGTSSRHVHILNSESEFDARYDEVPGPVLQRLIARPEKGLQNEFTCSVFKCADGRIVGPFTASRLVRDGHSHIIEVRHETALYPLLEAIAASLDIMGSFNIQLMMGKTGPVPFEFNARFSGTTAVRAYFGFNEPAMAVRHFVLGEKLETPRIRTGMAFRYDEHVFVEGKEAAALASPFPKGEVPAWF